MASATGANFLGVTHSIPGGILPGKSKLLYSVLNKTNTAQGGGMQPVNHSPGSASAFSK